MKKIQHYIPIIWFLLVIFGFEIWFFLLKDQTFSVNENRYLAQAPTLSVESILSGTYMSDAENYVTDQFPARDWLMSEASLVKELSGRQDFNGVFLGKNHHLLVKVEDTDLNQEQLDKNMSYVSAFIKNCPASVKTTFLMVPTGAAALEKDLPAYAPHLDEAALMKNMAESLQGLEFLDLTPCLTAYGEDAYYKTDHHWTTMGAFAAYQELAKHRGWDVQYEVHDFVTVSKDYLGSLYSKVLLPDLEKDSIILDKSISNDTVICDGEEKPLYDEDALQKKDQYGVFFGGNYGKVEMTGTGDGTVLVIKDSFANSFVPFLLKHYQKIVMIDLRYDGESIQNLMNSNDFTEIIFLYNTANFIEDKNLIKLILP